VRNIHSGDGGLGGGSDAWLLWEDNYLYVFAQMDVTGFHTPDELEEWQTEQPWMLTTFEVIIDFANEGGGHEAVSMVRSDDSGFLTMHAASQDRLATGGECKQYVEFGYSKGSNYFTMEFKINIPEFRKAAEAEGLNFGGDFAAGKAIGLYMFSQEKSDDGDALFISVPSDRAGNWVPDNYDFVVLGDALVGVVAEPDPVEAADESAAGGGESAPEPPPAAAAIPSAPATGDGAAIFIALAIMAAAAFVITKRVNKNKA